MSGDPLLESSDPWGRNDPPVVSDADLPPLPPVLAEIVAAFENGDRVRAPEGGPDSWPGGNDLLEVRALAREGWAPVSSGRFGDACDLLPAIWPRRERCWLVDRVPELCVVSYGQDEAFIEPDMRSRARGRWEVARLARTVGLPPPPANRLWLLRSPWPSLRIGGLLRLVRQVRDEDHLGWDAVGTMRAAQRVLAGTEEQAWDRWHGPRAEAARAWLADGHLGADVDRWIDLGLGPADLDVLTRSVDDGGAGLPVEKVADWCRTVSLGNDPGEDVVDRVREWRATGLPADAPVGRLMSVMYERRPAEIVPWLQAGFAASDIAVWEANDLPRATRWRDAGFDARTAHCLVVADPTLTPDEAIAFDAAGIDPSRRHRWVAAGFSAAEAREWTDLDVVASEARVWRSLGLGPDDARAQRVAGAAGPLPAGFETGWAAVGSDRDDMSFGVSDPPGTRGSTAAEHGMGAWAPAPEGPGFEDPDPFASPTP